MVPDATPGDIDGDVRKDRLEHLYRSSDGQVATPKTRESSLPDAALNRTSALDGPEKFLAKGETGQTWLAHLMRKAAFVARGPNSKPAEPTARTASDFQNSIADFVYNDATPAEQALMHRARGQSKSSGNSFQPRESARGH